MTMKEPEVAITPTYSVPSSRAIEWFQGLRPLPCQDALLFFQSGIGVLYDEEEAMSLLRRHRALEAQEAGDAEIPPEVRDWLISHGWQEPSG